MSEKDFTVDISEPVILTIDDGIAFITLNRPKSLNALSESVFTALRDTLYRCEETDGIRVIILGGAGESFCAGGDISSDLLQRRAGEFASWMEEYVNPIIERLRSISVPVIAAVDGHAAGAGFSLALACDFIIASERASFTLSFAKIGAGLDMGASWTLPRAVGSMRANAMAMLAAPLNAAHAESCGLVFEICPESELMARARRLAMRLIAGSTAPALAAIKDQFNRAASADLTASLSAEARTQGRLILTPESAERINSFRNRDT